MALTANPTGFALRERPNGMATARAYTIDAAYATPIGYGDAVILNTNGTLTVGTAAADILGTFAGVHYKDATGKPVYAKRWPGAVTGATDIVAYAYTDLDSVYEVQVASGGTAYVQTIIGAQADLVAGTPNAITGMSAQALNATPAAGGAQAQFRIIGFGPDGMYDATNNPFPTVMVQIARHQFAANKVGI